MATPWRARPTRNGATVLDRAATVDPITRMPAEKTRTFFLPYMSASRPETGIVTAAARSVAVTAHDALPGSVPRSLGSSLWIGITRDCMREPDRLPRQSTAITRPGPKTRPAGASGTEAGADDIE